MIRVLASAAVALLLFQTADAHAAKLLRRGLDSEVESLDPQKGIALYDVDIQHELMEGLTALDMDLKPVPGAALSWDVSADSLTYTFHLRPDGKWSNGDPVTADDFVYAMRRGVDPRTGASDPLSLRPILNAEAIIDGTEKDVTKLGVDAVDPLTLRIRLQAPCVILPLRLTDNTAMPLHRASIEKWGQDWTKPGHFVGNGAFILKDWVPQSSIVLVKNPLYHDAAEVKLDEVDYLNTSDIQSGLRRWEAGELDVFDRPPVKELKRLKVAYPGELLEAPVNSHNFLTINMVHGPLSQDLRLRQALSMAVDRETITQKIIPDGNIPSYALIPPVMPGYVSQPVFFKSLSQSERVAKAKELMKEAGYGPDHPLKVSIIYATNDQTRTQLLAIAAMWKPIGVEATLENMEWQVYLSKVQQKDYEIGAMGEYGLYNEPEDALINYISRNASYNYPGYKSAEFDRLYDEGRVATTIETRNRLFEQAERQMMADMPIIPTTDILWHTLVHKRVVGWRANVVYAQSRYLSVTD
ncbi:MAG TPA: peptide ABC transporter substrate-binding protein [Aliidongia sp.]|uniref:peptide ABC transporter substrate-binding protein n=1 Tax=Aliidongia sp. TaxID=1914230 RepID=UPI002DDCBD89|nr:peptide ABC transporter substrate-binding protein [Aliidongia sp.]HEV2675469.1 peptide ABC transporter substrate-binding protein [Aliidongia sp.]